MTGMEEIRLNSHAKLNLSLRITGKKEDGYHEIVSFMQGTGIHDVVTLKKCSQNGTKYNLPHCRIDGIVVYLCTDTDTIPAGMGNLAFKGIKAFISAYREADEARPELPDVLLIEIDKRLPVAAGIAGGSGNAAVCMLGMNALVGSPLSLRELMRAGVKVGADVPFSLFMNAYRNRDMLSGLEGIEEARDSAWTFGIGDIVEAADPEEGCVILANLGTEVSTKAAYEAMDSLGYDSVNADERTLYVNDLEKYTLREDPGTAGLKALMQNELDADEVLMSGSGPTLAAYYKDDNKAEADLKRLTELTQGSQGIRLWITTTGK